MLSAEKILELKLKANEIRKETVKTIASIGVGHIGGSLSIADVMAVLYFDEMKVDPKNPKWDGRDWLVVSKGHSGPAIYSTLAIKGFFDREMLYTLNKPNTNLPSHCDMRKTPGIDMTTGSLGQGASAAAGIALGNKMDGKDGTYTYLILGDGELDEGQVWEMALFANTKHLDNLIAFVDYNKLQIDGRTDNDDVCNLGDIAAKFASFGWYAQTVNGHEVTEINQAIENAKKNTGCPSVIVLDTIKGYGWSKTAGQVGSHSRGVSPEDLAEAMAEIQAAMPPESK